MTDRELASRAWGAPLRRNAVGFCVVATVVLLQLGSALSGGPARGRMTTGLLTVVVQMPIVMAALTIGYRVVLARRVAVVPALGAAIAVSAVIGAICGVAIGAAHQQFAALSSQGPPVRLLRFMFLGATFAELQLGLWAFAFVLPPTIEAAHVRALEAGRLRAEAEQLRTGAELARLRAHLEPHFLLNTLNAIAGLVTEDPREARRLLVCLGELLRDALRDEDELETLDDQVRWLRRYAEILEARHAGRVRFEWDVAPELRPLLLPRLLLQPLVENAVQHGVLRRRDGGRVVVRATCERGAEGAGALTCVVEDDGPGVATDAARTGAFGLHAVRRRLQLRYGARADLKLESSADGTRSIVSIPLEPARIAAEAS